MTRSSPRFERAVRQFDIIRILRQAGLDPQPSGTDELVIKCPFCVDHRLRLGINQRTKLWQCFNCSRRGNVLSLLMAPEVTGLSYEQAVRTVVRESYRQFGEEPVSAPEDEAAPVTLPREFQPLLRPPVPRSEPFWRYLTGRGLQPSLIEQYGMGYCRTGAYRWRVIIPVTLFGELKTFVARIAMKDVPRRIRKVLYPQGSRTGEALFNIERVWGAKEIVLTEGVFDALALPNKAVAVLGSNLTDGQISLLEEAGAEHITLCYDPDAAGRRAVLHAEQLEHRFDVSLATLPSGLDPAKAPPTVLQHALTTARPFGQAEKFRVKLGLLVDL